MSHSNDIAGRTEEIRQKAIDAIDSLARKAGEFGLAKPPEALEQHRRKLREDDYKVLVVGGAKRGKSTFVNALLGRDVLPINIATSQVFNIRSSEREAYRVRLEDGSQREISSQELPFYSTQATADAKVISTPDQVIHRIEIEVLSIVPLYRYAHQQAWSSCASTYQDQCECQQS
ncbi:MAG: dynamin family protein [Rubrobacter sp.]|nr:dynamin family protein [Rubrobacter sp.]